MHLVRRGIVSDLVGGGGIALQVTVARLALGGQAIIEYCRHLSAHRFITAGFLLHDGCQVDGVIHGKALRFGIGPVKPRRFGLELGEHGANQAVGGSIGGNIIGFREQEAFKAVRARRLQEAVIARIHAGIRRRLLEGIGADAPAGGAFHRRGDLGQAITFGNGEHGIGNRTVAQCGNDIVDRRAACKGVGAGLEVGPCIQVLHAFGEFLGRPHQLGIHQRGAYGVGRCAFVDGDGGLLAFRQKLDLRRHAAGNRGADEPQDADAEKRQNRKEHVMRNVGSFGLDVTGIVRAEHTVAARVRRACRMVRAAGIGHLPTRGHLHYLSPAWRASSHA